MLRRTTILFSLTVALLAGIDGSTAGPAGGETKGIKQIMKSAHLTPENRGTRNNLDSKVVDGKATDAEKKELLQLYTALAKATPGKGSEEAWKKRTTELVDSLQAIYRGDAKAKERFLAAQDCKTCHALHR